MALLQFDTVSRWRRESTENRTDFKVECIHQISDESVQKENRIDKTVGLAHSFCDYRISVADDSFIQAPNKFQFHSSVVAHCKCKWMHLSNSICNDARLGRCVQNLWMNQMLTHTTSQPCYRSSRLLCCVGIKARESVCVCSQHWSTEISND